MEETETLDVILKCVDCGANYILTLNERKFYSGHGLHLPLRCPRCRQKRKREKEAQDNGHKDQDG